MGRAARVFVVFLAFLAASPAATAAAKKTLDSPTGVFQAPRTELALAGVGGAADAHSLVRPAAGSAGAWWGGPVVTSTGETVTLYVSSAFVQDESIRAAWAEFFAWLYHGPELASLVAYQASLAEIGVICGPQAAGCYAPSTGELIFPGDAGEGMDKEIAAHEYGHHVAANRSDDPWPATDWGPKRWATAVGVCSRVAAGTAFPGDEGDHYALNPAEAFAEAYRVLNEGRGGTWAYPPLVVDPSLAPDAQSLVAALADVQQPWSQQSSTWDGAPPPPPPTPVVALTASVGPGAAVSLRTRGGAPVTSLDAGRYALTVRDGSAKGNFHLVGPRGVERKTSVAGKTTVVWNLSLAAGSYRYFSDARPRTRHVLGVAAVARVLLPAEQTLQTGLDGTFWASVGGQAGATLGLVDPATGKDLVAAVAPELSFVLCGQRTVVLRVVPTNAGAFHVDIRLP